MPGLQGFSPAYRIAILGLVACSRETTRINVDFPAWVMESVDRDATRIGVTRQLIIKVWLVERLKAEAGES